MAVAKDTRKLRDSRSGNDTRDGSNFTGDEAASKTERASAQELALAEEANRSYLGTLLGKLRHTTEVIIVSTEALRRQNTDYDVEIANVLQRCASDPLSIEIDRIEVMLGIYEGDPDVEAEGANVR